MYFLVVINNHINDYARYDVEVTGTTDYTADLTLTVDLDEDSAVLTANLENSQQDTCTLKFRKI